MARPLPHARACHLALGIEHECTVYLASLLVELKRRRKLMTILDRHGL
ncbi:hypothetical protein [Streptomyces azureus]|uniref:Uncharacterized protein n=1 Tax=Streptomyces azureus TaxID=146537 RepID=A0A0K8PTE4_STRAJ|nr:hypothetical protein [Streptomyces azureus]GAP51157.1 hypothetical protein SAZU_6017 [Streptomyces azureus]